MVVFCRPAENFPGSFCGNKFGVDEGGRGALLRVGSDGFGMQASEDGRDAGIQVRLVVLVLRAEGA